MPTLEELEKDQAAARANAPSAETLAELDKLNALVLCSGFVYIPKNELLPKPEPEEVFKRRMGWA